MIFGRYSEQLFSVRIGVGICIGIGSGTALRIAAGIGTGSGFDIGIVSWWIQDGSERTLGAPRVLADLLQPPQAPGYSTTLWTPTSNALHCIERYL
jgi:hypothetical protein